MRISDWSSDVCSSDLVGCPADRVDGEHPAGGLVGGESLAYVVDDRLLARRFGFGFHDGDDHLTEALVGNAHDDGVPAAGVGLDRLLDLLGNDLRSEARSVGNGWLRTCKSRWST